MNRSMIHGVGVCLTWRHYDHAGLCGKQEVGALHHDFDAALCTTTYKVALEVVV